MTVELGSTELALAVVGVLSVMGGALAFIARWLAGRVDVLMRDQAIEWRKDEARLQNENDTLRADLQTLRHKQATTEAERLKDRALLESNEREIADLRMQLGTLLVEMAALQDQVKKLTEERDAERDEKERVRRENTDLRDTVRAMAEQNKSKDAQIAAYRDALALVRGDASPEAGEGAGKGSE
jgi:chromosome segregation ATPase